MTKGETTTQENLLQTQFELEAENERLHDVLDKIRAEIKSKAESGQWSEPVKYGMLKAITIIDKYRKEQK